MMVQFLHAGFLWAALAALAPILIHLLVKQRRRRKLFSTLRFLQAAELEAHGRRRLREWLVLIMRCFALLLLSLALSHPVGRLPFHISPSPPALVFVLDDSYSMSSTSGMSTHYKQHERSTRFQRAKDAARWLLQRMPNACAALLLASKPATPSVPFTTDHQRLNCALERVQFVFTPVRILSAIAQARQMLDALPAVEKRIYVFTDLQRTQWRLTELPSFVELKKPSDSGRKPPDLSASSPPRCIIVDTRSLGHADNVANVAIVDSQVITPLEPALPRELNVKVRNFGGSRWRGKLTVTQGGKLTPIHVDLAIETRSSTDVRVPLLATSRGWHHGLVRIEGDGLPADDVRYFAFYQVHPVKALCAEVGGGGGKGISFYVRTGLASVRDAQGRRLVEVRLLPLGALSQSALQTCDVVLLLSVPSLPSQTARSLSEAVQQGKGLMVFSTRAMQWASYEPLLGKVTAARWETARRETSGWLVGEVKPHPALSGFSISDFQAANFTGRSVLNCGDSMTLISFSDGAPLLWEKGKGEGVVLIFNSSPDAQSHDLPLQPVFVPLLYRLVSYAAVAGKQVVELSSSATSNPPGVRRLGERFQVVNLDCFDSDLRALTPKELKRLLDFTGWEYMRADLLRRQEAERAATSDLRAPLLLLSALMLLAEMLISAPSRRKG